MYTSLIRGGTKRTGESVVAWLEAFRKLSLSASNTTSLIVEYISLESSASARRPLLTRISDVSAWSYSAPPEAAQFGEFGVSTIV